MDEIGAGIVPRETVLRPCPSQAGPGHARVARALGTGIVAGEFPEGAVLPAEPVLLARFGVSRTLLREAVKTLSGKGLLEARTRVGTRVRERAAWNLFDREAIYARIRQADSAAAAAMARYEATVTTALEETDTAISAWLNERVRRTQLAAARTASDEASHLARLRYREGVEDFLTVLDAERSLLAVEDELAQSEIQLAQSLIDIHLALGGGWQDTAAATP